MSTAVQRFWLRDRRPTIAVQFRARGTELTPFKIVHTGSEVHPAYFSLGGLVLN